MQKKYKVGDIGVFTSVNGYTFRGVVKYVREYQNFAVLWVRDFAEKPLDLLVRI